MWRMMTDLTLWHAPLSRSTRILWLLEEIGCSYRLETLTSTRSLDAALHPVRAPALRDGDMTMHETGAMTEWLCETRAPPSVARTKRLRAYRLAGLAAFCRDDGPACRSTSGDRSGRTSVCGSWPAGGLAGRL